MTTNQTPLLDFGREVTSNPLVVVSREWLVTNGIGGFASGRLPMPCPTAIMAYSLPRR